MTFSLCDRVDLEITNIYHLTKAHKSVLVCFVVFFYSQVLALCTKYKEKLFFGPDCKKNYVHVKENQLATSAMLMINTEQQLHRYTTFNNKTYQSVNQSSNIYDPGRQFRKNVFYVLKIENLNCGFIQKSSCGKCLLIIVDKISRLINRNLSRIMRPLNSHYPL